MAVAGGVLATTRSPTATVPPTTAAGGRGPVPTADTAPPTPLPGTVSVGATVGASGGTNPAEVQEAVESLSAYFVDIDQSNYVGAYAVYDQAEQSKVTESGWAAGEATTTITAPVLEHLDGAADEVDAEVAFTSHQSAADGPDGATCDTWTLTYRLVTAAAGAPTPLQIDDVSTTLDNAAAAGGPTPC